ncbi:MAG: IS1595 family transposase [Flavobacteriales bacterium]|nr:IS1595 family transposase [Flavobacteriales bacterium]
MTIAEFYHSFKDESSCKIHLKLSREKSGISCKKCGHQAHYWLSKKEQWQCKNCNFRTTLRSGTLFESSNLPLKLWYEALYLVCNTKKGISACELQRQLGLKRYEPAWYMMHKIRKAMSRINEMDQYHGNIELSNTFFTTLDEKKATVRGERKSIQGNQKQKALIMAASSISKNQSGNGKGGGIRILAVEDLKQGIIWKMENHSPQHSNKLKESGYRNYKILNPHQFQPNLILSSQTFIFPWIHTAIGNIKRLIKGIYHHVSDRFSQLYFDEFAFKFNYRNRKDKWNIVLNSTLE